MRKPSMLFATLVLGLVAAFGYAQAPVPFINQPLLPDAAAPGGPDFTLTVNGTGFVSKSTVNWNHSPLVTSYISGAQLKATVPAADVATASTAWVTVVNPAPGGGTSNTAFFTVTTGKRSNVVAFKLTSPEFFGTGAAISVATGDFNGDGKLDLAFPQSIALGDGTGNFSAWRSLPIGGFFPYYVATGDFNGDGKLDLAIVNSCNLIDDCYSSPSTVSIVLGDGTGNFSLVSSPAVGYLPTSVGVGDFNGDGELDLAVTNSCGDSYYNCPSDGSTVSILLGDGTGKFTLVSSPAAAWDASSVAVGDFNGDGKLDLAVPGCGDPSCESGLVSTLLGDGAGNFTVLSSPTTVYGPSSVAAGDFNGDGKLDLAVTDFRDNTVSILLGDGTGNFTLHQSWLVGLNPSSVVTGDFNGDGKLDLAVANYGESDVAILFGRGTGDFIPPTSNLSTGDYTEPASVAVGDFNGDGKLDVVAADFPASVSILLQVPPYPIVALYPGYLVFGTQLLFTASPHQTVGLVNIGTAPLDITSIVASNNFFELNYCGSSLAPGARCNINVTFLPHSVGEIFGTVTITDSASDSPQTISLVGEGTMVSLLPGTLSFDPQPVGTTSPAQTVTMTNHGKRSVGVGFAIYGANSLDFAQTNTCGNTLPAGARCTISVTFTPQAAGTRTAALFVSDDGVYQEVTLSGTGT